MTPDFGEVLWSHGVRCKTLLTITFTAETIYDEGSKRRVVGAAKFARKEIEERGLPPVVRITVVTKQTVKQLKARRELGNGMKAVGKLSPGIASGEAGPYRCITGRIERYGTETANHARGDGARP